MLEHLERANLFLVPLDEMRHWYRYHQLFAEVLRARFMRQKGNQELAALYVKASEWYELNGFPTEAVETALTGGDYSRAAVIIAQIFESMLSSYRQATLLYWLERLPTDMLQADATLSLAHATCLFLTQSNPLYEPSLQAAERLFRTEGNLHGLGKAYAFRAIAARPRGDAAQAIEFGNKALQLLPEEDLTQHSVSLSALGMGYRLMGNVEAARQALTQATALSQRIGNIITVLTTTLDLGALLVMQGKLHEAAEMYQQVIASTGERPRFASEAFIGKGTLFYEWNDLVAAEHHFQQAISLASQIEGTRLMSRGLVGLARVMQARGETERAAEMFTQALALAEWSGQSEILKQDQAYRVRWWLSVDETENVVRWREAQPFTSSDDPSYEHEIEYLTFCRVLIALGESTEALQILERWQYFARTQGRIGGEIEILVLSSLAYAAIRKQDQAMQLLENALLLAEAERYIRLFVDEGRPMLRLLNMLRPRQQEKARTEYVNTLILVAVEQQPGRGALPASTQASHTISPLIEPLSQRERKVLRLLVAGRSNPEIADELVVSLNTVKTQVQSIYRKLNATNRKEARAIAHQLKLI
jgi:LuxR family maltose regulon positive regulatory protein